MLTHFVRSLPLVLICCNVASSAPNPTADDAIQQELGFHLVNVVPVPAANHTLVERGTASPSGKPKVLAASVTRRVVQPRTSSTTSKISTKSKPPVVAAVKPSSTVIPKPTTTAVPKPTGMAVLQRWAGNNFFAGWDFFSWPDPTHGQVTFLNQEQAFQQGLAYTSTARGYATTIMKVDNTSPLARGAPRNSVRITSKTPVTVGSLVVLDSLNIPHGATVWPAFWSVGENWPHGGEIDIIEGVHENARNQMTLHTAPGCTLAQPMFASGNVLATNCDVNVQYNEGCGVQDTSDASYGAKFNQGGGGVHAMSWTSSGITIWFFPRNSIPADIASGQPTMKNWGPPTAYWAASSCTMDRYFTAQTLVFDITLCGDWAGNVWNQHGYSGSCSDAVAYPGNYNSAFFEVNSVTVYKI